MERAAHISSLGAEETGGGPYEVAGAASSMLS